MGWDTITVLTLVSGIAMLIGGVLPDITNDDRVWSLGLGAAFVVYAFIGAKMTDGVFLYNPLLFAVPVLTLVRIGYVLAGGRKQGAAGEADTTPQPGPHPSTGSPVSLINPPAPHVLVAKTGQYPTAVKSEGGRCAACGKAVPSDLREFHRNGCPRRPWPAAPAGSDEAPRTAATGTTSSASPVVTRTRPHLASIRIENGRCFGCGKLVEPDVREFHRNACGGRTKRGTGARPVSGFDRTGNCFRCNEQVEPDLRGFHLARCT